MFFFMNALFVGFQLPSEKVVLVGFGWNPIGFIHSMIDIYFCHLRSQKI